MSSSHVEYLKQIEAVIANGPYSDSWASLGDYPVPEWYRKAKFGIFIHYGVYSVPAFGNEWYPRHMYLEGSKEFEHHIQHYGHPKDFGYDQFISKFKAERFDAKKWVALFKASGAKYIMPVAEHHDGFQMYNSDLSNYNAVHMGPHKDIIGQLKAAAEQEELVFTVSSHRAENYWFFGGGRTFDSGIQDIRYQEPYGYASPIYASGNIDGTHDIYSEPASREHLEDWLIRCCELVDRYQPRIFYFDWWIQNNSFKPYLKKFAAYYYNRAAEWGIEVAINYKFDAFAYTTAVFDIERGQLSTIRPRLWQTDTSIAKNSWCYTENNEFKSPVDIVCDLVDIVSKNGCLLLNVGPKADGTISAEETEVLLSIGKWLQLNGEAIYGTTYWAAFGEGPTAVPEGSFTDVDREPFTSEDIRFTYKAPNIYATVMHWPNGQEVMIQSLRAGSPLFKGHIAKVELLGYPNSLSYERMSSGLSIKVEGTLKTDYPVCFRITIE